MACKTQQVKETTNEVEYKYTPQEKTEVVKKEYNSDQLFKKYYTQLNMHKLREDFKNLSKEVTKYLIEESSKENLSPTMVYALLYQESEGKPWAKSPVGALGLMQIMPASHYKTGPKSDLVNNQKLNIKLGIKYLKICMRTTGNYWDAVQAYNTGHGAWLNGIRSKTHASRVFKIHNNIKKELVRLNNNYG
jgi:soluble lytic murein transglycosylase-like protein